MIHVIFLIISFLSLAANLSAQAIDNNASFRMMDSKKYVRLHYENDYFTATDFYYTQGINFESVSPGYRKFFLTKLLVGKKAGVSNFGIALEHNGYTPTSIKSNDILIGDRPFAASLMLKTFSMTVDTIRNMRITSGLTIGMVGPAAGGYEMQREIHRWINGQEPFGWQHQIQNDVIVNYEVGVEKNIVSLGKGFLLNGFAAGRAGTFNTKLSAGTVIMVGRMNPAIVTVFSKDKMCVKRKVYLHLYAQPMINIVGYDATLQGGLFNKQSPYVISTQDISRATFQVNYGGVLSFRAIQLEYFQTFISKEFASGDYHYWGGVRVGVKLL